MKLSELLDASESEIGECLGKKGLLHECDCGYTVYDPDQVAAAVQHRWGDRRAEEINTWASDLANQFGWLFIEKSDPKHNIYHCQHCADSEWSLLMDLEKIAESGGGKNSKGKAKPSTRRKKYVVYIDESYTNEFPRKPGGSLALAAFIVSQRDAGKLEAGLTQIVAENYRGQKPGELKYSKLSKYPGLLERVGRGICELICSLPSAAIILIYAPSEGLLQEPVRVARAVAKYAKTTPTEAELREAASTEKVEEAVRGAVSSLAQTISGAVGIFLGDRNLSGEIWFDPRSEKLDSELHAELAKHLPLTPINVPLFPHAGAVVMPPPSPKMERLGRRVKVKFATSSHRSAGLQIADFLAGDIRAFFSDVPAILTDGTVEEPLTNSRILFPEAFRPTHLHPATKQKISQYSGQSLLPHYRPKLVSNLVSCYAMNGQMRNVDLKAGIAFDIMD